MLGPDAHVPKLKFRRHTLAKLYAALSKTRAPQSAYVELEGTRARPTDPGVVGAWTGGEWELVIDRLVQGKNKSVKNGVCIRVISRAIVDAETAVLDAMVASSGGYKNGFQMQSQGALHDAMSFSTKEYKNILERARASACVSGPLNLCDHVAVDVVCKCLPGNRMILRGEIVYPSPNVCILAADAFANSRNAPCKVFAQIACCTVFTHVRLYHA